MPCWPNSSSGNRSPATAPRGNAHERSVQVCSPFPQPINSPSPVPAPLSPLLVVAVSELFEVSLADRSSGARVSDVYRGRLGGRVEVVAETTGAKHLPGAAVERGHGALVDGRGGGLCGGHAGEDGPRPRTAQHGTARPACSQPWTSPPALTWRVSAASSAWVRARCYLGRLCLRLAMTGSSGFRSGEYGGRKCSSTGDSPDTSELGRREPGHR